MACAFESGGTLLPVSSLTNMPPFRLMKAITWSALLSCLLAKYLSGGCITLRMIRCGLIFWPACMHVRMRMRTHQMSVDWAAVVSTHHVHP